MADCPGCGGFLKFDIPSQKVKCEFCHSSYLPEEVTGTQMAEEQDMMGVTEFLCPNCGGEIYSTDKDITGVCAYCGSNVVFESRLVQKKRPEWILPFTKTKEDCKQQYLDFTSKKRFIPKEMKTAEFVDGFRGIYMPYWLVDVKHTGPIEFYAKKTETRSKIIISDTYRVTGNLDAVYYDMYHDASSGFSDDISEKIEPFELTKDDKKSTSAIREFYPAYLSGFYAEPADVEAEDYKPYFDSLTDESTEKYLSGHKVLHDANRLAYTHTSYEKLRFLPPLDEAEENRKRKNALTGKHGKPDRSLVRKYIKEQAKEEKELEKAYKEKAAKADKEQIRARAKETKADAYGYSSQQSSSLAMFPVWFMSWKKNDRVAYATVNGQTGKVNVDLPVDLKEFFKYCALVFAICYCVLLFLTMRPLTMTMIAVWMSALTVHMTLCELRELAFRSDTETVHTSRKQPKSSFQVGITGLLLFFILAGIVGGLATMFSGMYFMWERAAFCVYSVLGVVYALIMTVKALKVNGKLKEGNRIFPAYLFSAGAAIAGLALLLSKVQSDFVMYAVCLVSILCIIANMLILILQFNKVATRPLPQFSHKGGDDRA